MCLGDANIDNQNSLVHKALSNLPAGLLAPPILAMIGSYTIFDVQLFQQLLVQATTYNEDYVWLKGNKNLM